MNPEHNSSHPIAPKYLIFVRHGKSVMNAAMTRLRNTGDHSQITAEMLKAPETWALTRIGKEQGQKTGEFLRKNRIAHHIHICSPFTRARQTAELAIPNGDWQFMEEFRERGVGKAEAARELMTVLPSRRDLQEEIGLYGEGESFEETKARAARGLARIFAQFPGMIPIIFSHHDVILTKHAHLARLSDNDFMEVVRYGSPKYLRVGNGCVLEYSRENPESGHVSPHFSHFRISDPYVSMEPGPWIELP